MAYLAWFLSGFAVGAVLASLLVLKRSLAGSMSRAGVSGIAAAIRGNSANGVAQLLHAHFAPLPVEQLTISERRFPFRMRADLQRTLDSLFGPETRVLHFCGVRKEYSHESLSITGCLVDSPHSQAVSVPPEYEELDIGEQLPLRVLKNGLWLLEHAGTRCALLLAPCGMFHQVTGVQFQIATPNTAAGTQLAQSFFRRLEDAVAHARSYRGKILSLEQSEHSYSGESSGIKVHKLRDVSREEVILPAETLTLLERNVVNFVRNRPRLSGLGMATKKGILFYGPPGTGKTHTIHHLAKALPDHTTLLISAEQVALLSEYMTLARLLQPSIVVMEDVDLIARDREHMNSPCEEVLLNKLLNEMDGLKEEADILFLLTTNRPQALEAALASRPGRIDQAIEFPLPDETGRRKLVALYSPKMPPAEELAAEIVRRTAGVSAAFIKELMRRIAQFNVERGGASLASHEDVDNALDEMLFQGGELNLKLLGATDRSESAPNGEAVAVR